MGKIVCEKCQTEFKFEIAKDFECCPICGASFSDNGDSSVSADEHPNWITWYYYKDPKFGDYSLWDKSPLHPEELELIKEFKAPPESECGLDEVKRILRTYVPDAFEEPREVPKVTCPYCFSSEIQLVPKKFSLLTGFATNKYDRVCVRCKRKF